MSDPTVQVRIIKGKHFHKEMNILWPDGARTELTSRKGVLHGADGRDYPIKTGDEHMRVCEEIIGQQGYSFRRR